MENTVKNEKISDFNRGGSSREVRSGKKMPAFTLRAGALKLTAWENSRGDFVSYSFTLTRVYKFGERWAETKALREVDLLKARELLRMAWERITLEKMAPVPANKLVEDVGYVE